jgi:suppressor for copper-sensitivity B
MNRFVSRGIMVVLSLAALGTMPAAGWAQAGAGSGWSGGFGGGNALPVSARAHFSKATEDFPARLFIVAEIKPEWHIYSITQPSGGPTPTRIKLKPADGYRVLGDFKSHPEPEKKIEPLFKKNPNIEVHEGTVVWYAPIEFTGANDPAGLKIDGTISALACHDKLGCQPVDLVFTAGIGKVIPIMRMGHVAAPTANPAAAPAAKTDVREGFDAEQLRQNTQKEFSQHSLAWELLLGFVGGIILNFMPCVLPVIGLKVLSFVEQSGHDRRQAMLLNVWYSLGLITVFLILAGLAVTLELGWGGLFQRPGFNVVMAAVVFAMALSFLGVWEIPIPGFVGRGHVQDLGEQEGFAGAFSKGVITTILATPCTGPFMGSALAWAVNQPPVNTFLVFGAVGLGMSSPYLLIGAYPSLLRFLPKPGMWMDTFKQVMGFVLLGTVVYIFTFLSFNYVVPTIGLLFALWAGLWWINRTPLTADFQSKLRAWMGATAFVGVCWLVLFPSVWRPRAADRLVWQPFTTRQNLEGLLNSDKTVMVDFTADWCQTCKWFEATVLDTTEVTDAIKKKDVVAMQADWTHNPPEITEMLDLLGGRQVPVIAIFPAHRPNSPIIFRGGYTKQGLLKAIDQATGM